MNEFSRKILVTSQQPQLPSSEGALPWPFPFDGEVFAHLMQPNEEAKAVVFRSSTTRNGIYVVLQKPDGKHHIEIYRNASAYWNHIEECPVSRQWAHSTTHLRCIFVGAGTVTIDASASRVHLCENSTTLDDDNCFFSEIVHDDPVSEDEAGEYVHIDEITHAIGHMFALWQSIPKQFRTWELWRGDIVNQAMQQCPNLNIRLIDWRKIDWEQPDITPEMIIAAQRKPDDPIPQYLEEGRI